MVIVVFLKNRVRHSVLFKSFLALRLTKSDLGGREILTPDKDWESNEEY